MYSHRSRNIQILTVHYSKSVIPPVIYGANSYTLHIHPQSMSSHVSNKYRNTDFP